MTGDGRSPPTSVAERPEDVARVPSDLEDLVPKYLERLKEDLARAKTALRAPDLPSIQTFGHKSAGSGGSYGFAEVSRLGREIERLAKAQQVLELSKVLDDLEAHLQRVRVVVVD